jgi:hypothetical protein
MVRISPPVYRGGNLISVREVSAIIMPVLTEAVQAVTELLPAHRKLTLEEFPSFPGSFLQDHVEPFVAARQALGNPVVFQRW